MLFLDEDSIRAATKNVEINGCSNSIDVTHTKYIYLGSGQDSCVSNVTIANILPGYYHYNYYHRNHRNHYYKALYPD